MSKSLVSGVSHAYDRPSPLITFAVLLVMLQMTTGYLAAEPQKKEGDAKMSQPQLLAATSYVSENGETRVLSIWQTEVLRDGFDLVRYMKEHPDRNSFPRFALMLVESTPKDLMQGKVVWVNYFSWRPQTSIFADVVWSKEASAAFVVVGSSLTWHVAFDVYLVQTQKELGEFPLTLQAKDYKQWPAPHEPIAQLSTTLRGDRIAGIREVTAVNEGGNLLLCANRDDAACPSVHFFLDVKSKKWSAVNLQQRNIDE